MQRACGWILAGCLVLQACANDQAAQTPVRITVLTQETLTPRAADGTVGPQQGTPIKNDRLLDPVVRISSRLIAAAQRSEYASRARMQCWGIAISDDPERLRAFVSPGGGIMVSTGTFRFAETEGGLAAVLSHELAHALAAEAPSSACVDRAAQSPPLFTYQEELHADEVGIKMMADAGYDPHEFSRLWEKLKSKEHRDDHVLEHFTYDRRIESIMQRLPDALIRYERANRAPQKALPTP